MNTQLTAEVVRVAGLCASLLCVALTTTNAPLDLEQRVESDVLAVDTSACAYTGPVNDEYTHAINMTVGNRSRRFGILPATQGSEGQGPTACWSTGGVENDLWYTFEAEETRMWDVSLCGSDAGIDSRFVVYRFVTGQPPTEQVACGDNGCGGGKNSHASASFYATEGERFYIQVGAVGFSGGSDAELQLDVD